MHANQANPSATVADDADNEAEKKRDAQLDFFGLAVKVRPLRSFPSFSGYEEGQFIEDCEGECREDCA
jgi:hypothetical protein